MLHPNCFLSPQTFLFVMHTCEVKPLLFCLFHLYVPYKGSDKNKLTLPTLGVLLMPGLHFPTCPSTLPCPFEAHPLSDKTPFFTSCENTIQPAHTCDALSSITPNDHPRTSSTPQPIEHSHPPSTQNQFQPHAHPSLKCAQPSLNLKKPFPLTHTSILPKPKPINLLATTLFPNLSPAFPRTRSSHAGHSGTLQTTKKHITNRNSIHLRNRAYIIYHR